jgi:hypothetical protein
MHRGQPMQIFGYDHGKVTKGCTAEYLTAKIQITWAEVQCAQIPCYWSNLGQKRKF